MSYRNETLAACLATAAVASLATYTIIKHTTPPTPAPVTYPVPSYQNTTTTNTSENSKRVLMHHDHEAKMTRKLEQEQSVEDENSIPRRSVTVRVPATSANMGPGYDCLGVSVDIWSEVTVERSTHFEIISFGDGAEQMPTDDTNYVVIGLKAAFKAAGETEIPALKYTIDSRIPFARGLGSSSAAIVAGIIAGLVLAGHRLPCWGSETLLQIAATIEGHPDNVAPVIYGGIQIGIHNGERWVTERIPTPPGLQMVLFVPDFIGKTSVARDVLPPVVSREEAAFNIGRVGFLVNALCQGNLDCLKSGTEDKLHQPQRGEKLYPYLYPMIAAATEAGANACYLSGAGPTIMALTSGASGDIFTQRVNERSDTAVAKAMMKCAEDRGITGRCIISSVSHDGARVIKVDPPFSTEGGIQYKESI